MTSNGLRLFISYAHADALKLAERLFNSLQAHGFSPWRDNIHILPGADWAASLDEAITNCHSMLALVSQASNTSPNCKGEQQTAVSQRKLIIPIMFQPDVILPIYLRPYQVCYFDGYENEERYRTSLNRLLLSLGQESVLGGAAAPFSKNLQSSGLSSTITIGDISHSNVAIGPHANVNIQYQPVDEQLFTQLRTLVIARLDVADKSLILRSLSALEVEASDPQASSDTIAAEVEQIIKTAPASLSRRILKTLMESPTGQHRAFRQVLRDAWRSIEPK